LRWDSQRSGYLREGIQRPSAACNDPTLAGFARRPPGRTMRSASACAAGWHSRRRGARNGCRSRRPTQNCPSGSCYACWLDGGRISRPVARVPSSHSPARARVDSVRNCQKSTCSLDRCDNSRAAGVRLGRSFIGRLSRRCAASQWGHPIASVRTIAVRWTCPVPATVKGIIHAFPRNGFRTIFSGARAHLRHRRYSRSVRSAGAGTTAASASLCPGPGPLSQSPRV
jgi:hypothetical protein